jgi:hypothetical protein
MPHPINMAIADSLHAQARDGFALIVKRGKALKTEGLDDELAVNQLITEIGVGILNRGDTPEFWDGLWSVCGALAYAAIEMTKDDNHDTTPAD